MVIIIPARLDSGRFPRKLLAKIGNFTVIEHTVRGALIAAQRLGVSRIIVAHDDPAVADRVSGYSGVEVINTKDICNNYQPLNGTERCALVAQHLDLQACEAVINIQGDNWDIHNEAVVQLAQELNDHSSRSPYMKHNTLYCMRETLMHKDVNDSATVKVVAKADDNAIFFTRAPLPYADKHCGIYGYHACFLYGYLTWPERRLESNEGLEQMRVIENSGTVRCIELEGIETAGHAINVPTDLATAIKIHGARTAALSDA